MLKKLITGLLMLCLLIPAPAYAAPEKPNRFEVDEIIVLREAKPSESPIKSGETVDLKLILKGSELTKELDEKQLAVVRLKDSFQSNETPQVKLISQPEEAIKLEISFLKLKYSAQDQLLSFKLKQTTDEPIEETYRVAIKQAQPDKPGSETPVPETPETPQLIPAPQITYRLKTDPGELAAAGAYDIILVVENVGQTAVTRPVLRVRSSEDLSISSASGSRLLSDIAPGKTQEVKLSLKVADRPKSQKQYLELEVGFVYDSGEGTVLTGSSDRLELMVEAEVEAPKEVESPKEVDPPADVPSGSYDVPSGGGGDYSASATPAVVIDSAVPNVIVKQFRYGDKPIAAGESFELGLDIVNTSTKLAVENIVMSIEPGENFSIDASTNVYHFSTLAASGSLSQPLKLKALPGAKTGSDAIEISFRYEYVENDKRSQANITQKLAIPIYQPDRFEIASPELPEAISVGEETVINLAYVNKGKSEVSNVEAMIEGEVNSVNKHQNLGNFEPGKSGNISFIITPEKSGPLSFKLKIQYEDANQETKTKDFPVKLSVNEAPTMEPDPEMDPMMDETEGSSKPKVWLMGIGLITLAGLGGFIWRKRHHRAEEVVEWDEG